MSSVKSQRKTKVRQTVLLPLFRPVSKLENPFQPWKPSNFGSPLPNLEAPFQYWKPSFDLGAPLAPVEACFQYEVLSQHLSPFRYYLNIFRLKKATNQEVQRSAVKLQSGEDWKATSALQERMGMTKLNFHPTAFFGGFRESYRDLVSDIFPIPRLTEETNETGMKNVMEENASFLGHWICFMSFTVTPSIQVFLELHN